MSDTVLYIIELEPGADEEAKWYVGISEEPERRLEQHRSGNGSDWVARNRIVGHYFLGKGDRSTGREFENILTKLLMYEFGKDTTRGGNWPAPEIVSYPPPPENGIPPGLAQSLGRLDNDQLSQLERHGAVLATVKGEIRFTDSQELVEWADNNLPKGTELEYRKPEIDERFIFTTE